MGQVFCLVRICSTRLAVLVLGACIALACGNEAPTPSNGVNDVRKACDIRVSWRNRTVEKCRLCVSGAPLPACGCESFKDFDGACVSQGDARRVESSCTTELESCEITCSTDCACVERCYDKAPECKRVSAARDGCVVEKCEPFCI